MIGLFCLFHCLLVALLEKLWTGVHSFLSIGVGDWPVLEVFWVQKLLEGFFTVVRWGVILNPEKRHSPHKMSYLEHISHYTVFVRG